MQSAPPSDSTWCTSSIRHSELSRTGHRQNAAGHRLRKDYLRNERESANFTATPCPVSEGFFVRFLPSAIPNEATWHFRSRPRLARPSWIHGAKVMLGSSSRTSRSEERRVAQVQSLLVFGSSSGRCRAPSYVTGQAAFPCFARLVFPTVV
jgi:hypothetical protein